MPSQICIYFGFVRVRWGYHCESTKKRVWDGCGWFTHQIQPLASSSRYPLKPQFWSWTAAQKGWGRQRALHQRSNTRKQTTTENNSHGGFNSQFILCIDKQLPICNKINIRKQLFFSVLRLFPIALQNMGSYLKTQGIKQLLKHPYFMSQRWQLCPRTKGWMCT